MFSAEANDIHFTGINSVGKLVIDRMRVSIILEFIIKNGKFKFLFSNLNIHNKLKALSRRIVGNEGDCKFISSRVTYRSIERILPLPVSVLSLRESKIGKGVTVCCGELGKCKTVRKHRFDAEVACKSIGNLLIPTDKYRILLFGILNQEKFIS